MASFLPHLLLPFLLLAATLPPSQARESHFFSKTSRYEAPKETTMVPKETQVTTMEEPVNFPPQSRNGPDQLPPMTTTMDKFYNTELGGESYENKETNAGHQNNYYYYNNNNNAHYRTGNVPSNSGNDEFNGGGYEAMESNTRYRRDPSKPYGMSDTRYVENGKYYYDVNADTYPNGYGVGARGANNGYGGYYGAKGNVNQYNNEMKGYHNNQENSEEYVP